jgi:multiple sugar transport system substrate-binding protein
LASCTRWFRGACRERGNRVRTALARALGGSLHLLLVACAAPESTTLELWAAGREGEVVAELIPEFEALHPGVDVRVQQIPWRGAHEKLLTAVVGGSTPDVAPLGNTWIPEFAMIGALDALDGAVSRSAHVKQEDYFSGAWDTNLYEGSVYGVPWYVDTRLIFYRKDLLAQAGFAAPPATWAEWLTMLTALQAGFRQRGETERFPILLPLYEYEPPLALGLQQSEPLLRDGNRFGNFRGEGFRRALAFYVSLFQSGLALHADNSQVGNKFDEFARGRFVFFIGGPWQMGELERRLPRDLADTWGTAPLPGVDGPSSSLALGASLVVFSGSKKKEAAWQLIEYLSRPDVQQRFYALTGDLAPRRASWTEETIRARPPVAAFREQLERLEATPPIPEWERIAAEVAIVAERSALGAMSLDEAVTDLDARADRILEKRRWMLERENRATTGATSPARSAPAEGQKQGAIAPGRPATTDALQVPR